MYIFMYASKEDEFDSGAVDISVIDIQPFQFEPLPGTSTKRGRPSTNSTQDGGSHDSDRGVASYFNINRIGNSDW